jgi:hypothetical protein
MLRERKETFPGEAEGPIVVYSLYSVLCGLLFLVEEG